MTSIDRLIEYWTNEGLEINSGISVDKIAAFQNQFKIKFSDSFLTYLKKTNGCKDFDSDSAWFSFWSLDRMMLENSDGSHPQDIIWFSDHSINLCSFGFSKLDNKIYTHYQTIPGTILIADNFEEFLDLYLADPWQLLR